MFLKQLDYPLNGTRDPGRVSLAANRRDWSRVFRFFGQRTLETPHGGDDLITQQPPEAGGFGFAGTFGAGSSFIWANRTAVCPLWQFGANVAF